MTMLPVCAEKKITKLIRKAQVAGKIRSYVKEITEFASAWQLAEQLVINNFNEVYMFDACTREHGATYADRATEHLVHTSSFGYNTRLGLRQLSAEKIYLSLNESEYNSQRSTSVLALQFGTLFGCCFTNRTKGRTNVQVNSGNVLQVDLERLRALIAIWSTDAPLPSTTKEAVAMGISPFVARDFIKEFQLETCLLFGPVAITEQLKLREITDNEVMYNNLMELTKA